MPAMANIVVKKSDEATNITYDALTPAAGDSSEAVWRQDTGAVPAMPVGHRPIFKMKTTDNGTKTARRSVLTYSRPYSTQNTVTSKYEARDSTVVRLEITTPVAIPASEINEAVYQSLNLMASALIKQSVSAGYAPA